MNTQVHPAYALDTTTEKTLSRALYQALDLLNLQSTKGFHAPRDTYIGVGAAANTGKVLAACGITKVFVVIDEIVHQLGLAEAMWRALEQYNIAHTRYVHALGEPESTPCEAAARECIASGCNGMVAIGGGSALDTAKVVAILAANPAMCIADLSANHHIHHHRMMLIAIPTTAGTGSEATNVTVIKDSTDHVKHVIVHPDMLPDLALIDPGLTLRVPPYFTAATGIDALTHAIEAYVATQSTPLTRALAYQAIVEIGRALPIAVGQGENLAARESMALASYMAGIAFSNAGLGLCHALAHQIGPKYNLPHGIANAIMLPSAMHFNQLVCKQTFTEIGLALCHKIMPSEDVIAAVQNLIAAVMLPTNLSMAGGNTDDFLTFAEQALTDICLTTNPRTVSKEQIMAVYQHALHR
ncbi:MAG: iron-containing alcohol dehydrogenase [Neisseriales bacterium]|nr:MAG: iron-containing alcohol dehydrogenase [Neisseriales bacterium]